MEQNTWDISTFYSKAWEIVKKHKMLWIFGIAASAGGASSFNSGQSFSGDDFKGLERLFDNKHTDSVLGAATTDTHNSIVNVFTSLPMWVYLILIVSLVSLAAFTIIIALVYKAWSTASLLHAVENGISDKEIQLGEISAKALPHIKPLVWLQIVPWLLFVLASIGYFFILILVTIALSFIRQASFLIVPFFLVGFGGVIFVALKLTLSEIWASRNIILHNHTGKHALITGYEQTKGKFWQMLLLGIVNLIAGIIVTIVPIAIIMGVAFGIGSVLFRANPNSLIVLLPVGLILSIAVVVGISLLSGMITSFKATVWSLAYKTISS